ncbi:MAG: hypothetical protein ACPHRO_08115, partial [Nannocystaceae bacterium]
AERTPMQLLFSGDCVKSGNGRRGAPNSPCPTSGHATPKRWCADTLCKDATNEKSPGVLPRLPSRVARVDQPGDRLNG